MPKVTLGPIFEVKCYQSPPLPIQGVARPNIDRCIISSPFCPDLAGQSTLCDLQLSEDQNKEGELVLVSAEFNFNCAVQIEKYVVHILEAEASRDSGSSLLSPEELAYAKEYADSMDSHLNTLLLRHMPSNCQKIDRKKAGKVWCPMQ